jgi:hypothetical protein
VVAIAVDDSVVLAVPDVDLVLCPSNCPGPSHGVLLSVRYYSPGHGLPWSSVGVVEVDRISTFVRPFTLVGMSFLRVVIFQAG